MKSNLKIGWLGFHEEGILALKYLLRNKLLSVLITLDDNLLKLKSGSLKYQNVIKGINVPIYKIKRINDIEVIDKFKNFKLDILFVIGWGQILNSKALEIPKVGVIGAHASLLPELRGSAPINWALIKGYKETGNTEDSEETARRTARCFELFCIWTTAGEGNWFC